jgi:hypothetical protein
MDNYLYLSYIIKAKQPFIPGLVLKVNSGGGLAPGRTKYHGHNAVILSLFPQVNVDTIHDHGDDLQLNCKATLVGKLFNPSQEDTIAVHTQCIF